MQPKLAVSEHFYSIQGEGKTAGVPSVFLRLKGCDFECHWCLGGNTEINVLSKGIIPLKEVKVGDLVWSYNEDSMRQEFTKVTRHTSHEVDSHYSISFDKGGTHKGRILSTGEHPFWVVNRGWIKADSLKVGDVVLELDNSAIHRHFMTGKKMSEEFKASISLRMQLNNPMKRPEVVDKVKRYWASHEDQRPNSLAKLWKTSWFRDLVSKRMRENNPMFDPEVAAKSCDRPWGSISRIEQFVADIVAKLSLPILHNKGKTYIGGKVPDFIVEGKKKVIEVTHSTYLGRAKKLYAERNLHHYAKYGWSCLTLFVDMLTPKELAYRLINFAYNGKTITRIAHKDKKLRVYNLTTENHTFFANSVLTHNCDTIPVWKKGVYYSAEGLVALFSHAGYFAPLQNDAHLVLTGGNPLLQQRALVALLPELFKLMEVWPYVEVETQGSIKPSDEFSMLVHQWNVSPKLANSQIPKDRRLNFDVLKWFKQNNSIFKFPVCREEDLVEVTEIVDKLKLEPREVYLMPICSTRKEHEVFGEAIVQLCLRTGYRFSPRLQLVLWDKTVGV